MLKTYCMLFIAFCMLSSGMGGTKSCSRRSTGCVTANGSFTYTLPYCGGPALTPEMLKEYEKEEILSESTLVFISDAEPHEQVQVKTDTKGKWTACLPSGKYKVYLTEAFKKLYPEFDPSCKKWMESTWVSVSIDNESKDIKSHFSISCNPCLPPKP